MPQTTYQLDQQSVTKLQTLLKKKSNLSLVGNVPGKNSASPGFWAKITDNNGDIPPAYSWTKEYTQLDGSLADAADASGTYNAFEVNQQPVADGEYVWMTYGGNGFYQFELGTGSALAAGTYCPVSNDAPSCDGDNAPAVNDVSDNVTDILFHASDFDVTQPIGDDESVCDEQTILVEAKPINLRVEQYAGNGGPDDHCAIKNLVFNDFTVDSVGGMNATPGNVINKDPDNTNPPDNYYEYDVYFAVTEPGDVAVCECSDSTTETRKSAFVAAQVFINPCDYYPDVNDCNDNNYSGIGTFTFGDGLTVTNSGDCSTGDSEVTVDVRIEIDEESTDFMFATAESDEDGCYYNIGICTQDIDVVTDITCVDGVLTVTKTTVTVLVNCD